MLEVLGVGGGIYRNMMSRACIVILGMHRSGTSALAGVLNILGVDFGHNLLPPSPYNPKGYFENAEIVDINKILLKDLNARWDVPAEFPPHWWTKKNFQERKAGIKTILNGEFADVPIFGIKDPRLCLVLPLYLEIFKEMNIRPCLIINRRKRTEIAQSLKVRNNFSLEKVFALCDWYEEQLQPAIADQEFIEINFDDLLNAPRAVTARIEKIFQLRLKDFRTAQGEVADFLSSELKHHNSDGDKAV